MAELTNLESKLGEVLGLAMAAQGATEKVKKLPELENDLTQVLDRMHEEAEETELLKRAREELGEYVYQSLLHIREGGSWKEAAGKYAPAETQDRGGEESESH